MANPTRFHFRTLVHLQNLSVKLRLANNLWPPPYARIGNETVLVVSHFDGDLSDFEHNVHILRLILLWIELGSLTEVGLEGGRAVLTEPVPERNSGNGEASVV